MEGEPLSSILHEAGIFYPEKHIITSGKEKEITLRQYPHQHAKGGSASQYQQQTPSAVKISNNQRALRQESLHFDDKDFRSSLLNLPQDEIKILQQDQPPQTATNTGSTLKPVNRFGSNGFWHEVSYVRRRSAMGGFSAINNYTSTSKESLAQG